jgi:hypothetical protein
VSRKEFDEMVRRFICKNCPKIFLEILNKTTKICNQDNLPRNDKSDLGPPYAKQQCWPLYRANNCWVVYGFGSVAVPPAVAVLCMLSWQEAEESRLVTLRVPTQNEETIKRSVLSHSNRTCPPSASKAWLVTAQQIFTFSLYNVR